MKNADFKTGTFLIVPGWQNSDENHWQSRWQSAYGWARAEQAEWMRPQRDDWTRRLIEQARAQASPPILVAHSLGCTTIAHAVAAAPDLKIKGAFLVAPPDMDRADTPEEIRGFTPTPLGQFPFPSVLVASSNDPFSERVRSHRLAEHWGSRFKDVGDKHHIGGMAGLGNWDEGLSLLAESVVIWRSL